MRKFISVLLVLCMCLSIGSVNVFAEDDVYINSKWYLDAEDCISIDIPNKKGDGLLDVLAGYISDTMSGIDDMYVSRENYSGNLVKDSYGRLLHDYYVLNTDYVITVKNISPDDEILLGIQLEAIPKLDETSLDGVAIASGVFKDYLEDPINYSVPVYHETMFDRIKTLSFSKDGNLIKSMILYAGPNYDLSNTKLLSAGDSFSFKLPLMDKEYIWAIQVRYFAEGDNMEYIMHSKPYFVQVVGSEASIPEKPEDCIIVYEPFGDVKPTDYYYDAVIWAEVNGITEGTSFNIFSPDKYCSHNEIITFLWRANGSPVRSFVSSSDFPYAIGTYYSIARKWLVYEGIIDKTYNGDAFCTRADVVNYLYALSGVTDYDTSSADKFTDIYDDKLKEAVSWAVDEGITDGTSDTTFSPDEICTRGQIVTFLYRAYANK